MQYRKLNEKLFQNSAEITALYDRCVKEANSAALSVAESRFKIIVEMLNEFPVLRMKVAEYLREGPGE